MPPNPFTIISPRVEDVAEIVSQYTAQEEVLTAVLIIKFIFVVLSVFFFLHTLYLIYKLGIVKDKSEFYLDVFSKETNKTNKDEFLKKWMEIKERMVTMRDAEYKLAIIEADKLFDELLKKMTYKGKDMGERLTQINSAQLSSIDGIWTSHKVRNLLVHDISYQLNFSDAQKIIQNYENAFYELKMLD